MGTNLSQISSDYRKPCSFLHLVMLTDTVRARPASRRQSYRPCARPVSRDRGRSCTFCVPSRRLESVGLSLQTACPRPRGTQADSPAFLRALGARPKSARSEYGPKSSHPDPCRALHINLSTDRIPPVSTCAGDRLNSPADPPHLTLGHQTTLGPLNVRRGGVEKRDSYIRTRVQQHAFGPAPTPAGTPSRRKHRFIAKLSRLP